MGQARGRGSGPNERRVVGQAARAADQRGPRGDLARRDVALEAQRRAGRDGAVLVDPRQLGAERAGDALALRAVAGPDAHDAAAGAPLALPVLGGAVLHERDRGGLAARLDDGEHGPGRGLAQDPRLGRDAAQHGGRVEGARQAADPRRAAAHELGAARDGLLDERLDDRQVLGGAQRAHLGLLAGGVADDQPLGTPAERAEQRLGQRRDAHEPPDRGRMAPARGERRPQRGRGDLLDRGALEHEHRSLRLRPGQRHHARARVSERRARLVAVDDGQQLLRDPGAQEGAPQPLARERRRGDEHDAVAGQQRGGDLERRLRPRRGGRAEHPDHAARLLHADGAPPAAQQRGAPEPAVGERARTVVGEVAQPGDRGQELAEDRLRPRPPGLAGEQQAEVLELVQRQPRGPADVTRPRGRGHRRPQGLRGRGAGRRGEHLVPGGRLDRAQPLAGRGGAGLELHPGDASGGAPTLRRRGAERERSMRTRPSSSPRAGGKRSSTTSTSGSSSPKSIAPSPASASAPSIGASAHSTCRRAGSKASSRRRSRSPAGRPRRSSSAVSSGRSEGPAMRRRTGGPPGTGKVRRSGEVSERAMSKTMTTRPDELQIKPGVSEITRRGRGGPARGARAAAAPCRAGRRGAGPPDRRAGGPGR